MNFKAKLKTNHYARRWINELSCRIERLESEVRLLESADGSEYGWKPKIIIPQCGKLKIAELYVNDLTLQQALSILANKSESNSMTVKEALDELACSCSEWAELRDGLEGLV